MNKQKIACYAGILSFFFFIFSYHSILPNIRFSSDLCEQEILFLEERTTRVQKACERLALDGPPITFAYCGSGGSCRAVNYTLGILLALEKLGLLDMLSYVSGLSGSTWMLVSWVASGLSVHHYALKRSAQFQDGFPTSELFKKLIQTRDPAHAYGEVLADLFLKGLVPDHYTYTLADLAGNLTKAEYPLPLGTAVAGSQRKHHLWFEFSPYECGNLPLGFLPTQFFGGGKSLGYWMSVWGSAFALNLANISYERRSTSDSSLITKPVVTSAQKRKLSASEPSMVERAKEYLTHQRLFHPKIPNHYCTIPDNVLHNKPIMSLVDGGFDLVEIREQETKRLNIAIIPLLRPARQVDIILIGDSSGDLAGAPALKAAQARAYTLGLPFPTINYDDIDQRIISVFGLEEDPPIPIIIYMPGIANPRYDPTFNPQTELYTQTGNFRYTSEQCLQLSGLACFNVFESKEIICKALQKAHERKKAQ